MNSIRRAITVERNRLLKLSLPSIMTHQKHNASSYTYTSKNMLRNKSSPKPKSPNSNDTVLKKQVTWAKPSEIPWQAKVVNSVNLIGRVKIPVQFEASADGKKWAGTIISQDDHQPSSSSSMPSFWIPVIFEGDLAHIAMSHLKEKDFVHVVGHLSVDVPPFKLSEAQANVQVMAHSVNYVQEPQSKQASTPAVVENNVSTEQSLKELDTMSIQPDTSEKRMMDVASEEESYVQLLNDAESYPFFTPKETKLNHEVDKKKSHGWWKDLVMNTKQWLDNREKKQKGEVKPNYPDFKHKNTGAGLWLDNAPAEILQDLEQLFGALPRKATSVDNRPKKQFENSSDADSWKDLLENPSRWWDNRLDKRNIKGPDFKNKESGKALWLTSAPEWVSSSLPPLKAKRVDLDTPKNTWAS
uniref:protein OSB2, chloroplastic-like n=1 Tax=Erigeron canadensis TaxID=72917 RepID=UPI001CB8DF3A|nr:protein OSB2, chloroplastic-like [Erigeron canadensis]